MSLSAISPKRLVGIIPRRPAVPAAVALMAGIFAHDSLPAQPILGIALLSALIATALLLFERPKLCSIALLLASAVAGLAVAQIEAFFYPLDHISAFATEQRRLAQLELSLDHPPRVLSWPFGQYRALAPKQVATASVRRIKTWNGWTDCRGDVLVQIAQPHPRLQQGQVVRVIGMLERPGPAMNPGQFDWAGYYREQRILASVQIAQADNITILEPARISPLSWLREQARRALARGFPLNRALDHALLRALVLGDTDPELRDIQEQFRRTGTSHHLAISGMHVAVLGGVVFGICRLLRLGPRAACWASLVFVVLYGAVALPSPPVVRSVLLCLSFGVGILQRRSTDAIQLLALTVLAMLVYHPLDLYNAGFQLSFGTVLGLMIFTRPMLEAMARRDIDEDIAHFTRWPGPFEVIQMNLKRWIVTTLAAGIVAWIVSMPLIALHFEQLNPWAVLASILLAPIVFLSLIGGFAKIVLTLLWPSLAGAWAGMATSPIAGMRHTVDWLATFPGADVPLPSPPVWAVLLYYALLLSLLIHWPRPAVRKSARVVALAGCVTLAILPLREGFAAMHAHAGELKVTLLAIGGGQCAVIEPPGAQAVLVDAGSATLSDLFRKALGPFLRHEGRRDIRSIFISHANYDHFSAIAEVAAAYDVGQVMVSDQFAAQSTDNPPAVSLLRTLDAMDRAPRQIEMGQTIDIGPGVAVQVVWPPEKCASGPNNSSLVLRLSFAGRTILFTGDLQSPGQRELLDSGQDLHSDVLIAPHHGSYEPTSAAFVAAVNPAYILASDDRTPSAKQRAFDQAMSDRLVYRTHTSGAIVIRISRIGQVSVDPFRPLGQCEK